MKKNLFFAALASIAFASCANDDLLVDETTTPTDNQVEIGFDTYANGQTRATENNDKTYAWNLEDHHATFSVWSTKQVAGSYIPVHGDGKATASTEGAGVVVTYGSPTASVWNPASKKYWDKAATSYKFYAAAPSTSAWVINNNGTTTNYENAYFTISGVTLAGTNLTETSAYTEVKSSTADNGYKKSWKDASGDVDLMIAAPCTKTNISSITSTTQTVELQFIHILSRLNVAFKKSTALDNAVVKVTDFKVVNLVKGGNFNEIQTAPADGTAKNCHWTPLANDAAANLMTIQGVKTSEVLVSNKAYYTIQSLVIPQNVAHETLARNGSDKTATSKPYVYVSYTIDGEPFEAYINLAAAFGMNGTAGKTSVAFNEGWQNNLTVTIDALEILFDATVSEWADDQEKEIEVK